MPVRAVLFDIGDTLWRFPGEDREVAIRAFERAGRGLDGAIACVPAEDLANAVFARLADARRDFLEAPEPGPQRPTVEYFGEAFAGLGLILPPEQLRTFSEAAFAFEAELAALDSPEPEMADALNALRSAGLRLAGVSNTFSAASVLERVLAARGLGGYLETIVSSADVGYRKPHARAFLPALRYLDVEPADAVFVGDRLDMDVVGSTAIGMRAVLTHQYRQEDPENAIVRPDAVISHLRDLMPYVESLMSK